MEGKCLKCRYHDLVVNSVCQLRLSQLWQQTAPGSQWLMTTKACISLRQCFHCKSVQGLFHVIFTLTQVEGMGSSVMCQSKGERNFAQKQHFCSHVFAKASHVATPEFNMVAPGKNITRHMATYDIHTVEVIFLQKGCQIF